MDETTEALLAQMKERADEQQRRREIVQRMEADVTPHDRSLRGKQRRLQRKTDQRTARAEHR